MNLRVSRAQHCERVRPPGVDALELEKRPRGRRSGGPAGVISAQAPGNTAHHSAFQAAQGLCTFVAGSAAFLVVRLAGAIVSGLGQRDSIRRDIELPVT